MIELDCYQHKDTVFDKYILNMILCFTVEELEWEFRNDDDRQWVDISNCGKTIKKKSGDIDRYGVWMRLKNENNINLKYEMKVTVKSKGRQ